MCQLSWTILALLVHDHWLKRDSSTARIVCCGAHAQWRARAYYRAMSFGRSPLAKMRLRLQIALADIFQFICLIFLGILEYIHDPRPLSIKKRARKTQEVKKEA